MYCRAGSSATLASTTMSQSALRASSGSLVTGPQAVLPSACVRSLTNMRRRPSVIPARRARLVSLGEQGARHAGTDDAEPQKNDACL
jgi:hypothetical protein